MKSRILKKGWVYLLSPVSYAVQKMIKNFEKSMQDLEKLVNKLEKGELSLEESLNQFEKGVNLTKKCTLALTQAEQKIQKLTDDNNLESMHETDDE